MRLPGPLRALLAAMALSVALVPMGHADVIQGAEEMAQGVQTNPEAAVADPQGFLAPLLSPGDGSAPPVGKPREAAPGEGPGPGFAERLRQGFQDELVFAGLATVTFAAIGLLGVALVTRYITPKEALKNPQRAMLYGFVRGNPGVHLKRLSEEFHMKTSSILWHIRKLESAELVRSERSNGFRVFYPTAGGIEVRNVGRAVAALQNHNAHQLFMALAAHPGVGPMRLAESLAMHAGTARWHLKKLKEFGLVEEVPGPDGARYLPTPLGQKAFAAASQSSAGVVPSAAPPAAVPA